MNATLRTRIARTAALAGLILLGIGIADTAQASVTFSDLVGNGPGRTRGDYNGDGFSDLAAISKDGSISVVYGSANGLSTTATISAQTWTAGSFGLGATFNFNRAGTSGDFNGDGYTDLAALGNNEIWVINGSATGLTSVGAQRYIPSFFFNAYGGNLPYHPILVPSLIAGDFNSDGFADLVVAGEHLTVGSCLTTVSVAFGRRGGLGNQPMRRTMDIPGFSRAQEITAQPDPHFRFAVGRIDGRPGDDLIIGAPCEGLFEGSIRFVSGSTANGIEFAGAVRFDQNSTGVADTNESGDFFGQAVAVGDFNRDGFADVMVGSSESLLVGGANVGRTGAVHYFKGGSAGIAPAALFDQSLGITKDAEEKPESGDMFGASLAAGDFNADGYADLAIGAPGETISGKVDAGALTIVYGSPNGVAATAGPGRLFLHMGTGAATGDKFAASLVALDFGRNGTGTAKFFDLAIGVPSREVSATVDAGIAAVIYGSTNGATTSGSIALNQSSAGMPSIATTNARFAIQLF